MDRYQNIVSGKVWKCCRVLSLLELRAAFPYLWESWKTVGTMEYFKDKFRLRESLELCRIWEKKFLLRKVIWLRTREGRRNEGREQMGLEDTLDEKTFKGEEWYDVSGSERWTRLASRLQKALLPNKLGQFWGEIQSKLSVATLPPFFHIIGVGHGILW